MAPQALEKGQVGAPGWSTDDGLLDAFLKETVDTENLLKLETMPVTRRIAVARLLQSRIAQVRNATAYICKVISTAQQDAPESQSVTSKDPTSSQQSTPFPHGATQPCMSRLQSAPQEPTTPGRMSSGPVMSPEACALQQRESEFRLKKGTKVRLHGLQQCSLNGKYGQVIEWMAVRERYSVLLEEGRMVSIKGEHLDTMYEGAEERTIPAEPEPTEHMMLPAARAVAEMAKRVWEKRGWRADEGYLRQEMVKVWEIVWRAKKGDLHQRMRRKKMEVARDDGNRRICYCFFQLDELMRRCTDGAAHAPSDEVQWRVLCMRCLEKAIQNRERSRPNAS